MSPILPDTSDAKDDRGAFDDYCEELLERMRDPGGQRPSRDEMDRFLIRSAMHSNRQRIGMVRRIDALEFHIRLVYVLIAGISFGAGAVWWALRETNIRPSSDAALHSKP